MMKKRFLSILLAVCMGAAIVCAGAVPAGAANSYGPPANLDQLSEAEQLAYFNLVVNRVRAERPAFEQSQRLQLESFVLSLSGLQSLLDQILADLMPGVWEQCTVAGGQSNRGLFLSNNENASDLRLQDIASIRSEKQGANWVISLQIPEEINPALGINSANGRIARISSREQILGEFYDLFTVDPADMTLRYYDGFAEVTVNSQGQVIVAENGVRLHAQVSNARVAIFFSTDIELERNAQWKYINFDWPSPPWWSTLSPILQFLLRWFCFGWLWMK